MDSHRLAQIKAKYNIGRSRPGRGAKVAEVLTQIDELNSSIKFDTLLDGGIALEKEATINKRNQLVEELRTLCY
jgi:hypothetical protein